MSTVGKTFTTPEGRCSFPCLFTPRPAVPGSEPKFSVVLLLPKADPSVQKFLVEAGAEINRLIAEKWPDVKTRPGSFRQSIKDGDKAVFESGELTGRLKCEKYPEMKGAWIVTANGTRKPTCIDRSGNKITDETVVYAGCWIRAMVHFYAYSNVNVGVGCSLDHVLFVRDGDAFGGTGAKPEDGFADFIGQPAGPAGVEKGDAASMFA
jgi:hypothetical protein